MQQTPPQPERSSVSNARKRPYHTPELKDLGLVVDVTQNQGSGNGNDDIGVPGVTYATI